MFSFVANNNFLFSPQFIFISKPKLFGNNIKPNGSNLFGFNKQPNQLTSTRTHI